MRIIIQMAMTAVLLCCGPATLVSANEPVNDDAFFKGKAITYIVATKPGGGYDTYARLIAEFMSRHLGAEIRVKNVPGAGNIVGTNLLYISKPDGLTIGTFNTGLIYAQLLQRPGVEFDLRKLSWIGSAAKEPRVIVMSKASGITSLEQLRALEEPALFGSSGVGSASHNEMTLISRALGLNVKIVPGFSGGEAEMSMMRGELSGVLASYSSLRPFVENGYGHFIARVGGDDSAAKDLPQIIDYATDANGTRLIALIEAMTNLARLTAGPPGIPAPRLQTLRRAYLAALNDPGLLARAAKLEIPIRPMSGEKDAMFVGAALDQPDEVMHLLTTAIKFKKR